MAINNTIDRTTFGAGDDALSSYGDYVRNSATLITFGDRADGIFAYADGTTVMDYAVVNDGLIKTNGRNASGISAIGRDADILNRGDIRTAGSQSPFARSDGIVVTGDRFRVVNEGDITVTGQFSVGMVGNGNGGFIHNAGRLEAHPIAGPGMRLAGSNGLALNTGVLIAEGSLGIGSPGGSNFALVNRGRIEITSAGLTTAGGIGFSELSVDARAANEGGVIVARGPDAWGTAALGTRPVVENSGRIEVSGAGGGGLNAGAGLYFDVVPTTDARVGNSGSIRTAGDGSIGIFAVGDGASVVNSGRVETAGGLRNEGPLGPVHASALIASGDGVSVLNERDGVLRAAGEGTPAVQLNVLDFAQTAAADSGARLENRGRIDAEMLAIVGGEGEETVLNFGRIGGDVDLGGGDDSFTAGRNGRLDGGLTLGDGDDFAVLERGFGKLTIADFQAGAGGEDEIDLSAWSFGSFGAVLALASERDGNTIVNLGGGDRLVLEGVGLASLSSGDFLLV